MLKIFADFVFKPALFQPTYRLHRFDQLLPIVQNVGTKMIIFDKDDTLTTLGSFQITDTTIKKTIEALRRKGISLKVLSNSIKKGDPTQIQQIQILRVSKKKPFNADEVLQVVSGTSLDSVMIVGDRLMTDVYLANKIGCKSVLVPAVEPSYISKHGLAVVLLRGVQNIFLKLAKSNQ